MMLSNWTCHPISPGLCDITLNDTSFSTCIERLGTQRYFGGIAKADQVPQVSGIDSATAKMGSEKIDSWPTNHSHISFMQNSLHDFKLELFCAPDVRQGIDYDNVIAELTGNIKFLESGIIERTGPGFVYYNSANANAEGSKLSCSTQSLDHDLF